MLEGAAENTSQQEVQHTLSSFFTKMQGLMFDAFSLENDGLNAEYCGNLATYLFRIYHQLKEQVDSSQNLNTINVHLGSKTSTSESKKPSLPLTTLWNALLLNKNRKPQKFPIYKKGGGVVATQLISKSIYPGLYLLKTIHPTQKPYEKYQYCCLVGRNSLPKGYQHDLMR